MTLNQYRRMCVFALRMVRVSSSEEVPKVELREHVREILRRLSEDSHGCHWSHIVDWENNTRLPDDDGTAGFAWRDGRDLLTDFMKEYCWDEGLEIPSHYDENDVHQETVEMPMGQALTCCIRAAVDVAVSPSGGVIGYTAGDLRAMWAPRPLPKWVTEYFAEPLDGVSDEAGVWL